MSFDPHGESLSLNSFQAEAGRRTHDLMTNKEFFDQYGLTNVIIMAYFDTLTRWLTDYGGYKKQDTNYFVGSNGNSVFLLKGKALTR